MRVTMTIDVELDERVTDAESVSRALDVLMETALGTPGVLDEYGDVRVGVFVPLEEHHGS
jgi:hypothetical protein